MTKISVLLMLYCFITVTFLSCSNTGDGHVITNERSAKTEVTNTKWTQWLDKYESLVDRNNALQLRIKSGDMDAAQEIMNISQEMVEVSNKCQENKSLMSSSEVQRMMGIIQKIKY